MTCSPHFLYPEARSVCVATPLLCHLSKTSTHQLKGKSNDKSFRRQMQVISESMAVCETCFIEVLAEAQLLRSSSGIPPQGYEETIFK